MNICVFGAAMPVAKAYITTTEDLGKTLGAQGHTLVFGGFANGLMQAIGDGFAHGGGKAIGIVPATITGRKVHPVCAKVLSVASLAERKQKMLELADAFVVLPGGIGTLDELFEVLALKLIGTMHKPVIIFNAQGYYDTLLNNLQNMRNKGFIGLPLEQLFTVATTGQEVARNFVSN